MARTALGHLELPALIRRMVDRLSLGHIKFANTCENQFSEESREESMITFGDKTLIANMFVRWMLSSAKSSATGIPRWWDLQFATFCLCRVVTSGSSSPRGIFDRTVSECWTIRCGNQGGCHHHKEIPPGYRLRATRVICPWSAVLLSLVTVWDSIFVFFYWQDRPNQITVGTSDSIFIASPRLSQNFIE